jgi:NADP-dependent 3-hydroxy acid dehydrogenase YdfG
MESLSGKIVLVTGASSGIGQACAEVFAQEGCALVLAARRINRLEALKSQLENKHSVSVQIVELDVRDRQSVFNKLQALSSIDILINNAGLALGLDKGFEISADFIDRMIDTNVKGLINVTQIITPKMIQKGSGDIINIGSIAGHEVYPGGSVYCASKHAVDAFTKGLRMDLMDTPLRVSAIDPGAVNTEFSTVRFSGDKEKADKVYEGFKPLTGKDIAEVALFIASRPPHVQIADTVVFATAQGGARFAHRAK